MIDRSRRRLQVRGIVQGVGFRPFVFGLAQRLGLAGSVRNDPSGVIIEVEGAPDALDSFRAALLTEAPPLAVVEAIDLERIPATGESGFEIAPSPTTGQVSAVVAPDVGLMRSRWQTSEMGPARRAYELTAEGEDWLHAWAGLLRHTRDVVGAYLDRYDALVRGRVVGPSLR